MGASGDDHNTEFLSSYYSLLFIMSTDADLVLVLMGTGKKLPCYLVGILTAYAVMYLGLKTCEVAGKVYADLNRAGPGSWRVWMSQYLACLHKE